MSLRPAATDLFRCYYVVESRSSAYDPRGLVPWEIIRDNERGRWDDPNEVFRVLYTAGTPATALIEVLAALRPSKTTAAGIAAIEDPSDPETPEAVYARHQGQAVTAVIGRLEHRYVATLRTVGPPLVYDVLHGASRGEIEAALLPAGGRLKTGAFATGDKAFTQKVSRYVFERTEATGIYAASAEDGDGYATVFFEHDALDGELRAALTVEDIRRAIACVDAVRQAVEYLDIVPRSTSASPSPASPTSEVPGT